MDAKSYHSTKKTLEEECKNIGFRCVNSQPLHGGDSSTCPSRNITQEWVNLYSKPCTIKSKTYHFQ